MQTKTNMEENEKYIHANFKKERNKQEQGQ